MNFKKNDIVRVYDYEELEKRAKEIDKDGDLFFDYEYFTKNMSYLCGKIGKIVDITKAANKKNLFYIEFSIESLPSEFSFTDKMFELVEKGKEVYKPVVSFDFDGVIHSYKSGWKGTDCCPDPVVEGIPEVIKSLREDGYKVIVHSSRSKFAHGRKAIEEYLKDNDIVVDGITSEKPAAVVTVDDRSICFNGDTSGLTENIKNFKSWTQK